VKALEPTITGIINGELQAQVAKAVEPVDTQMKTYQHLTKLSALARNDDRKAFDELIAIGNENPSEDVKSLAHPHRDRASLQTVRIFREVGLHQCPSERKGEGGPVCSLDVPSHVPSDTQTAAKVRDFSPTASEFQPDCGRNDRPPVLRSRDQPQLCRCRMRRPMSESCHSLPHN